MKKTVYPVTILSITVFVGIAACETASPVQDASVELAAYDALIQKRKIDFSSVLATVDGLPIYETDIEHYLESGMQALGPEDALNKVITQFLLASEARRRGGANRPAVVDVFKKALARQVLVEEGEHFTKAGIPVDVLRKEYQRQKNRFDHGRLRKVFHALVSVKKGEAPSPADWRLAKRIRAATANTTTKSEFTEAVDTIKRSLGPWQKVKMESIPTFDEYSTRFVKPFVVGTFAIPFPKERVSQVVQTSFGLHVIFVETEDAAENKSFESVSDLLATEMLSGQRRQHVQEFIDTHYANGRVFIYDEVLAQMQTQNGQEGQ